MKCEVREWSVARILGIINVRTKISEFIFSSKVKSCQFVDDAGAN
jgi:hypothetical protein